MSFCINPWCEGRENGDVAFCTSCGMSLRISQRFELLQPLKIGSDGDVFLALDRVGNWIRPVGTRVILKTLTTRKAKKQEMFEREAKTLQLLNHPGIPRSDIDDYFQVQLPHGSELPCLVLSYVEGIPLEDWITEHQQADQWQVLKWLRQLTDILLYIQSQRLIHRDIKPPNLIVQPDGDLALIDFGGAKSFYELDTTPLISPGYTPQEQIDGQTSYESDYFALGRTCIHLLTGIPPANLPKDLKTGQLLWEQFVPQLDRTLVRLLNHLTHPNWMERPRNSRILLEEIDKVAEQVTRQAKFKSPMGLMAFILLSCAMIGGGLQITQWVQMAFTQYYLGRANFALYENQPEQAAQLFQQAMFWQPNNDTTLQKLGMICLTQKNYDCAEKSFRRAEQIRPDHWLIPYSLGELYDAQQHYTQAERFYERAILLGGDHAIEAINDLARVKVLLKKPQVAILLAQRGLGILKMTTTQPGDVVREATLKKNLGWAYFQTGKRHPAEVSLQQAIALDPQQTAAYCLLAQLYDLQNRTKIAEKNWQACFSLESDLPEVKLWREPKIHRLLHSNP